MKVEIKTIYFDMDGTIADLYGVERWLDKLMAEDETPYKEAGKLENMELLTELLMKLQSNGIKIGVISWLSKEATKTYKVKVTRAKKEWLKKNIPIKFDETHFVRYGARKDYVAKDKNGLLFDDDDKVREKWRGMAINPQQERITDILRNILENNLSMRV